MTIKSLFRYLEILGPIVVSFFFLFFFDTSFLLCGFVSLLIFAVQYLPSYLHTAMEITTEKIHGLSWKRKNTDK